MKEQLAALIAKWRDRAKDEDSHTQCDLEECADQLEQALSLLPPAQGWEDMATVPDDVGWVIAAWPEPDGVDVGEAWRDGPGYPWFGAYENDRIEPFAWQPLLAAPPLPVDRETP